MAFNFATSLKKYKQNYEASAEARKAGAQAVRESPTAAAARNIEGYLRGVQESVTSGKLAARLNSVSLADWQQAYVEKGIANGNNGVRNLSNRAVQGMQAQQQYAEQVKQQIASMPSGTESDSVARMMKNFELMTAYGQRA